MDDTQRTSTWRKTYRVHPFADSLPKMSAEELAALAADIKANKLTTQVSFFFSGRLVGAPCIEYVKANGVLADGRHRMEALELLGLELTPSAIEVVNIDEVDPVAFIMGRNLHRRHLTKQQQADLIVAAHRATPVSRQDGGKLAEGRPVNQVKAAAVASAKALPTPISERTVERALAKAEGKTPATMPKYTARPMPKPKSGKPVVGIDAARRHYLDLCADPGVDLEAEQEIIVDALRAIDSKRALNGGKSQSPASALPQDGRSEDGSL